MKNAKNKAIERKKKDKIPYSGSSGRKIYEKTEKLNRKHYRDVYKGKIEGLSFEHK